MACSRSTQTSRGSSALSPRYSPAVSAAQRSLARNPTPWPSACTPVSVRPAPVPPVPPSSQPAPSPLHRAIAALANRQSLSEPQATEVFGAVMRGEATAVQIAALLIGLRVKGETAEEIAGAARALRQAMVRVEAHGAHLVDTCGTGGGTVPTFNIWTAAAFVAAGAGASVAKHANGPFTSQSGPPDARAPWA